VIFANVSFIVLKVRKKNWCGRWVEVMVWSDPMKDDVAIDDNCRRRRCGNGGESMRGSAGVDGMTTEVLIGEDLQSTY
jgi:hypothetical protein